MCNNKITKGALLWNIKKIVSKGDYQYAIVPEHPNSTKNGYVLLHRIIMENHLGRILNTNEVVHHIDGNKTNNIISNLQLLTNKEHSKLHANSKGKQMVLLKCPECGKIFTRERRNTYLSKPSIQYTCCSPSCRGKFSRKIQLYGKTKQVENAISGNLLLEYNSRDNSEETLSQENP